MRSSESAPILLDTHVWIWMQAGETGRLTNRSSHIITEAAGEGTLLLSVFSVWELGMLEAKGRIQLSAPCEEWVRKALATRGLTLAPLTPEIALESTRLPGSFHGDPADRIIAATARRMGARLLTRDGKLLDYARQGHIRVV